MPSVSGENNLEKNYDCGLEISIYSTTRSHFLRNSIQPELPAINQML